MLLGLLSDVHANLAALQVVLRHLQERGAERLLMAGDLVGYGAQPNECVELLASAGAECVAGNHDLFVLDRLPPDRFPPTARRSAGLTRSMLSRDVRGYLEELPLQRQVGSVLMTHGSLDSPEEYVTDVRRARELLDRLPTGADTLVLGHTHLQWCVQAGRAWSDPSGLVKLRPGVRLLNSGSVGQSRQREPQPGARCALYDTTAGAVDFLRLDYDVEASRRTLRALDLPERCIHAPPVRLQDRVVRKARRVVRQLRPDRS